MKSLRVQGRKVGSNVPIFYIEAQKNHEVGRAWGGQHQEEAWLFPAFYPFGAWALRDLLKFSVNPEFDSAALSHIQQLKNNEESWLKAVSCYSNSTTIDLNVEDSFFPKDFQPYPHQRLGMARLVNWFRSYLLWDMGTGKTRTTIDAMRLLRRKGLFKKALVVAPPVVLASWKNEVKKCSQGEWNAVIWDGTIETEYEAANADFVLVSYARARIEEANIKKALIKLKDNDENKDKLKRMAGHPLFNVDYDTIILDESQYLSNYSSKQTQACLTLTAKASRRYLLTGTAGDDPRKLYAQLKSLSVSLVPDYYKFIDRHVVPSPYNKHLVAGFKNLSELNARVNLIAHKMKKSECISLPPVTFTDIFFDLGKKQRARYNELIVEMRLSLAPVLDYLDPENIDSSKIEEASRRLPHGAVRSMKLLQVLSGFVKIGPDDAICNTCQYVSECVPKGILPYTPRCKVIQKPETIQTLTDIENPKLDTLESLLSDLLEADSSCKIIIWASFHKELDDIEELVKKLNYKSVRVDGRNSSKSGPLVEEFQTDEKCRVYIGQVSTGIGITLTAANVTIFYTLPWDPKQYNQALDRNNRPGQKKEMSVFRLLTSDNTPGIDRHVARILSFKETVSFNMLETVTCATCDRFKSCTEKNILPFREGCKFTSHLNKPASKPETV